MIDFKHKHNEDVPNKWLYCSMLSCGFSLFQNNNCNEINSNSSGNNNDNDDDGCGNGNGNDVTI